MVDWKFVPLEDRRFITVDVDLTEGGDWMQGQAGDLPRPAGWSSSPDSELTVGGELSVSPGIAMTAAVPGSASSHLDETDRIAAAIMEQAPLDDAVLRIRYRASEEQHRRVNQGALKRLALDSGCHRVYQITPEIVRENRARAAGVDETIAPLEALTAWMEANAISEPKATALREMLAADLQRLAA